MNVLAVSCHPDDIEIGCGGTLIRYAKEGHNVTICHCANGNQGHVIIMPEELGKIRIEEARRGGEMMGAVETITLDVGDLMLDSYNQEVVEKMTNIVRRVNPDVIITHDPDDYMKDHQQVSKLVFDASFSATVPHFAPGDAPFTHTFAPIFYMDTLAGVNFQPEYYVNITGEIEQKLEALDCHESQIKWMRDHDNVDFLDMVRTCSKYRGYQCGVPYAEGFKICKVYPRMTTRRLLPLDD